jgi:HEAT repeat protein
MRTFLAICFLLPTTAAAGRGGSFAQIESAIQTGNGDVIIAELERAERLICARCAGPVMELLGHPNPRVREAAAWWFARRPFLKQAVTSASLARLASADAGEAVAAAGVLASLRDVDSLAALGAALLRPEAQLRQAAVRALGDIADPRAEAAVLSALTDEAPDVRGAAVRAYAALRGIRDGGPLVRLLGDTDPGVRRDTAAVVGKLRTALARVGLEAALRADSDALVRRNAAWALGKLGDGASRPVLEEAAESDPVAYVRSVARASLVDLGGG